VTSTQPATPVAPHQPCEPERRGTGEQFPIRRCDFGWGVVWVRLALADDGDPITDGSVEADFTDAVDAAVRRFQSRHGLEVDGLVGPMTWFAMFPEFATPNGSYAEFDIDGSGRIEPAEVRAIGDSNSVCDVPDAESCGDEAP
jgi:peptidoglycan hydrolase-like protein with peptidoglycan-binding domain